MRPIRLVNERQADGSTNHVSDTGCSFGPCTTCQKEGLPEICDCLHSEYDSVNEKLAWLCSKDEYMGGVD